MAVFCPEVMNFISSESAPMGVPSADLLVPRLLSCLTWKTASLRAIAQVMFLGFSVLTESTEARFLFNSHWRSPSLEPLDPPIRTTTQEMENTQRKIGTCLFVSRFRAVLGAEWNFSNSDRLQEESPTRAWGGRRGCGVGEREGRGGRRLS